MLPHADTSRMDEPSRPLVGIIDADRRVRRSLSELLRLEGLHVAGVAADAAEALEMIERQRPDVLVIDPLLPTAAAGAMLLARIEQTWPRIGVVVIGWQRAAAPETSEVRATYVSKSACAADFGRAILDALHRQSGSESPAAA